ncbi:YicC/YloC family endoribonuclease [Peribacillus sp. SCS-155]|uniref:YicC/YloC family endoribonuclease n=1 Tax=Peribacillus sedimenti TaxID=3115297 RepID=UPI003906B644
MVMSMTGYGRGTAEGTSIRVTVEVKTVNHRFCEYHIRIPRQFMILEEKIKKIASAYIHRGRTEIFVSVEGDGLVDKKLTFDWELASQYLTILKEAKERFALDEEPKLQDLLNVEDIFNVHEQEKQDEELESIILKAAKFAFYGVHDMRKHEGLELKSDLLHQLRGLQDIVRQVKPYAPLVVEQYRARLSQKMADIASGLSDESRLLTEVAIFADKSDINEELTRLDSHFHQFEAALDKQGPIGRKLDFLIQEMNREVNTIGSKANDANITQQVVEMKSLLEKMNEQVQNIE